MRMGTPYNGETLAYTLKGNAADSGLFVIDPASGKISVAEGATLDFETDDEYWTKSLPGFGNENLKSYDGTAHYMVGGEESVITMSIGVWNVQPPSQPGAPALTRGQSGTPENPVMDASWTPQLPP